MRDDVGRVVSGRRGVIVAGAGAGDPEALHALAERLGWPVFADPRSGARLPLGTTVAHADALLRVRPWAGTGDRTPEVVLRLGAPHASKALSQWLSDGPAAAAEVVAVLAPGGWLDPERVAGQMVVGDPGSVVAGLLDVELGAAPEGWLTSWVAADQAADDAIAAALAAHPEPTEPGVARAVVDASPSGSALVVASSMPVRDVEWYAAPRDGLTVYANRGANGIDGVVSTAVGVAIGGRAPTTALVGDLAFLYDAGVLAGPLSRGLPLTVVVVDNDGGGIFSFLPQAEVLSGERFELLFGTPHGVVIEELAAGLGVPTYTVKSAADLGPSLDAARETPGVSVVVVRTDRHANVAVHAELHAAVAAALT